MPLYGQTSGSSRRFNALSCFNVRLARAPVYFCMPSETARTINLRSSRSKRLATVRKLVCKFKHGSSCAEFHSLVSKG